MLLRFPAVHTHQKTLELTYLGQFLWYILWNSQARGKQLHPMLPTPSTCSTQTPLQSMHRGTPCLRGFLFSFVYLFFFFLLTRTQELPRRNWTASTASVHCRQKLSVLLFYISVYFCIFLYISVYCSQGVSVLLFYIFVYFCTPQPGSFSAPKSPSGLQHRHQQTPWTFPKGYLKLLFWPFHREKSFQSCLLRQGLSPAGPESSLWSPSVTENRGLRAFHIPSGTTAENFIYTF